MPRKPYRKRKDYNPSDTKRNRIRPVLDELMGIEDPDDLMLEILEILKTTDLVPSVGKYYTFVYKAKTPNIQYDEHPLVGVTDIFLWGFRGINFHWGSIRQYTWEEVIGSVHLVYKEELKDLRALPFAKIRLNS
jgi:hypothetical protein